MNKYNDKGERNGYWEISDQYLFERGEYQENIKQGYWRTYDMNMKLICKEFFIFGELYCSYYLWKNLNVYFKRGGTIIHKEEVYD